MSAVQRLQQRLKLLLLAAAAASAPFCMLHAFLVLNKYASFVLLSVADRLQY
jgi:hypothetical protein